MTPAEHDRCYGRRLARNGLRVTRSDRQPYPWERLAQYRAAAALVPIDACCTVAHAATSSTHACTYFRRMK